MYGLRASGLVFYVPNDSNCNHERVRFPSHPVSWLIQGFCSILPCYLLSAFTSCLSVYFQPALQGYRRTGVSYSGSGALTLMHLVDNYLSIPGTIEYCIGIAKVSYVDYSVCVLNRTQRLNPGLSFPVSTMSYVKRWGSASIF